MTDNTEQKKEFKLKSKYLNAKQEELKKQDIQQMMNSIPQQYQTGSFQALNLTNQIIKNVTKIILFSAGSIFLRQKILQSFVYRQKYEKWAYYIFQYEKGQLGRKLIQPKLYYNHYILPITCYYALDVGVATLEHFLLPSQTNIQYQIGSCALKSFNLSLCTALFVSRNPKVLGISFLLGNAMFLTNLFTKDYVSSYF